MSRKVLLVEDDPALGYVIRDGLAARGFDVTWRTDGVAGLEAFLGSPFDVCLLDVMLPRKDGFTLAQDIRKSNASVPILFLTAKSMLEDKISGFSAGGDDYLVKPFSMEELVLRIEVFLRRTASTPSDDVMSLGAYQFDPRNLTLHHAAGDKVLTQKEADVLGMLCRHRDRVLKREEILQRVWGNDDYFVGRSLDVFISKLRKYLKDDPSLEIVNYHGVGFRLEEKRSNQLS
ncbi:MAG: response regulator transcription factor [Cyclobacteriaceae bacterium]|nr:response regulator transcription factor [Cyclobacteriaceae bacterium]